MGKKRTIWKKKLFDDASIRSMIFIYFTITALAASVLISLSLYQRMSRQVTEVVQEESQNLIAQVGRSVESYLRTIMKPTRFIMARSRMPICRASRLEVNLRFSTIIIRIMWRILPCFRRMGRFWRQSRRCV